MADNENKNVFEIKIKQGMEHYSNLMDIYDKNEFFYDSYRQAAYAITRIAEMSSVARKKQNKPDNYINNYPSEFHNNIIAFCADRGQGKTSAMISMADALHKMDSSCREEKEIFWNKQCDNKETNPVLDTHFDCLSVIDPTCFEDNDSIIRTVISKMFKRASDKWKSDSAAYSFRADERYRDKKEKLSDKFFGCFKGLDYLYKEKKEISSYYDDINMAAEYGDSNNFKKEFIELVDMYLDFMYQGHENKNSMLVIQIDDVDLNIEKSYSIVEEIRKYFVIPGVIVLMALHIGTLSRTIEQYYLQHYKLLIDISSDNTIKEQCHVAMERYITKFLPALHRIYLPAISKNIEKSESEVSLLYINDKGDKEDILSRYHYLAKNKNIDIAKSYENTLFLLIYAKTGIILTKQGNFLHEFLPDNFRQLNHFLFYMNGMEDIFSKDMLKENEYGLFEYIFKNIKEENKETAKEKANLALKNLTIFQNYFLNSWCPEKLSSEQYRIIRNIHKSSPNVKNYITVEFIKTMINNDPSKICENIDDIREQASNSRNTPLSDVMWALYRLKHSVNPVNLFTFIYGVKMYYTIHIHITLLQKIIDSIQEWKEDDDSYHSIIADDVLNIFGGRIFPMHYYMRAKLPFYIFYIPDFLDTKDELWHMTKKFTYACEETNKNGIVAVSPENNSSRSYSIDFNSGYIARSGYRFFDYMNPILSVFYNGIWPKKTSEAFYSILNMLCNLDLQECIYREFFKSTYVRNMSILFIYSLERNTFNTAKNIYGRFDGIINSSSIIKIQSNLKNLIPDTYGNNNYEPDFGPEKKLLEIIGKGIGEDKYFKSDSDIIALYSENDHLEYAEMQKEKGNDLKKQKNNKEALKAYSKAEEIYEALQCYTELAEILKLKMQLSNSKQYNLNKVLTAYDKAAESYEKTEDYIKLAEILKSKGDMLSNEKRRVEAFRVYEKALEACRKAEDIFEKTQNHTDLLKVLFTKYNIMKKENRYSEAIEACDKIIDIYEMKNSSTGRAKALEMKGIVLEKESHYNEALNVYRRILKIYDESGNITGYEKISKKTDDIIKKMNNKKVNNKVSDQPDKDTSENDDDQQ